MSTVFPIFLRAEHRDNPAARTSFVAEVEGMTDAASRKFAEFGNEARRQLDSALSRPRNSAGSLDLGVSELRAAADAQEARAAAAREVAAATRLAAQGEGDYSQSARLSVAATEALAREEREAAQAARAHADAAEQVQAQLDRQRSATSALVVQSGRGANATRAMAGSAAASRTAFVQLGQQMQDVTVQAQLGTNAFTIFSQQVPQAAFALSGLERSANATQARIGRFATFLAGPWGAAIFAATAVLGPFIADLITAGDEAGDAEDATFEFAEGLDVLELSASQAANAMEQLAEATRSAIAVQGNFLRSNALIAEQSVSSLEQRLADAQSTLSELENEGRGLNALIPFNGPDFIAIGRQRQEVAGLRDALREAQIAATNSRIATAQQDVLERADPALAARNEFERQVGQLEQRFRRSQDDPIGATSAGIFISEAQYEAEFERLTTLRDTAIETAREANSARTRGGGNSRAERLSDEERALQQATEAAESYIAALDREIEAMGASAGQLRQLEVERAKAAAPNDDLRRQIEERNALREEAITIQQRQEAARRDAQATAEFESGTLQGLRDEIALLGLAGPARQRAALALEETAFKARLAAQGVDDVNAAWIRYRDLQLDLINRESVLEREAQAAELLAREIDRLSGALSGLGGAAGALGGLFDFINGRPLGGPLGAILDTTIGTRTGDDGELIAQTLGDELRDVFGANGEFSETLSKVIGGAGTGILAGTALFGRQDTISQLSSAVGGAVGQAAGEALTEGLSGILGAAGGPLGSILGGIAGGFLGGLISGSDRGSAIISGGRVSGFYGDTQEFKDASGQLAGSALEALDRLAEALGAQFNGAVGRVSIGIRDGVYSIDPQGRGYTKTSEFPDIQTFGSDAEAAVRAAILDLINDGVIEGLSAAEERLLRQGTDIEKALADLLDFRSVFDRLAQFRDPVGFEIDQLNSEFEGLIDTFTRAGASAAEFAELEELYALERAEIIEKARARVSSALQDLLNDLNIGDSGLSLRDRQANALAEYEGLAARVEAGDVTAFDDFAQAARDLLAIEREIFGSGQQYFDRFNEVRSLSEGALSAQGLALEAEGRDSPFGSNGIDPANVPIIASIDSGNAQIVNELGSVVARLDAANRNLGQLIANTSSGAAGYPLLGAEPQFF
ncbi:hypothetical protein GCM10023208_24580 [Erythrobacter westpacificensis]|uniref:Bacteriophage tail tape measure N-terminal domain-containing protein n=1 Tax=Erythrobacter westpacificensis TaxID=1055231 RepID=A0ABP9KGI2_9SPHN